MADDRRSLLVVVLIEPKKDIKRGKKLVAVRVQQVRASEQ